MIGLGLVGIVVLVLVIVILSRASFAGEVIAPSLAAEGPVDGTLWYDIADVGVEGKGWTETKSVYDRLPAKAEGVVTEGVWALSQHSAGFCARFVTDATTIKARWTLRCENLAMQHMPATGVSGLDLYARADDGRWRWVGVGQPIEAPTNSVVLADGITPGKREYLLYLPLYNGVTKVELGVPAGGAIEKASARNPARGKPIVYYGTSIAQGGCASRPGTCHTAILGRRLEREVINLGFSGCGTMDIEMATLMTDIDASVYVIDCLPNMESVTVAERVEPFVCALREARPNTPIVLVEDRSYGSAYFVPTQRERNLASRRELQAGYKRLVEAGVANLLYLPGDILLDDDGEGTVDGSHPTDLGFARQADAMEPVMKEALEIDA